MKPFVGGVIKGKGQHVGNKVPVMAIIQRGGSVRSKVMPTINGANLNIHRNLSIVSTPARTLPRCSLFWFKSLRSRRLNQFLETLFLCWRLLLPLADELLQLPFFSRLFEVHFIQSNGLI
jgi:hypothetical protein